TQRQAVCRDAARQLREQRWMNRRGMAVPDRIQARADIREAGMALRRAEIAFVDNIVRRAHDVINHGDRCSQRFRQQNAGSRKIFVVIDFHETVSGSSNSAVTIRASPRRAKGGPRVPRSPDLLTIVGNAQRLERAFESAPITRDNCKARYELEAISRMVPRNKGALATAGSHGSLPASAPAQ